MRPSAPHCTALLLLAACSAPPTARAPKAPADAERAALAAQAAGVSSKAQALLHAQDELVWKSWTEGSPADLAKTYAGTDAWLTLGSIGAVERLRQASTASADRRAAAHLHAYLVTEWLAQRTAELSEAATALEASMTFASNGQERPYRNLETLLAAERSALRRRALYEAATPAVEKLAQVLAQRRARTEALVAELGIDPLALTAELRDAEVDRLVALAEEVLSRTQPAFAAALGRLSWTELQLPVERVGRADVPRLFRLQSHDAAFPRAEITARALRTLQGLGIDPASMPNVTLDLREAPGKNPRGLVLGVSVPDDVRLSLLPVGGARDQREALHQTGHLIQDSLTQERRWELARLGNRTVGEAWSFLLEDLMLDPVWLERVAGLTGEAQISWRTVAGAQRLFLLRRAAGKVLFNAAARAPGADVRALYREVMARTYGFPMTAADEARAELDREEFLASADYLRAFLLAAELRQQLEGRFGASWWQEKAAGDWIRGLLAPGRAVSADALVRTLGEDRINVEAYLVALPPALSVQAPAPASAAARADAGPRPLPSPDAGPPPVTPGADAGGVLAAPEEDRDAGPGPAPQT